MNSSRVLFISHDANRAGSQLLLLELIRLLTKRGVLTHVLLCEGGELVEEFRKASPTTLLNPESPSRIQSVRNRVAGRFPLVGRLFKKSSPDQARLLETELKKQDIGLVVVNSVANSGFYYERLKFLHQLPVVLFAHELELSVTIYTKPHYLNFLLQKCSHLITVSEAVAHFYINKYQVTASKVSTFTLINTDEILTKISKTNTHSLEEHLSLPPGALVVGGCGNAEWRKGNDIFNLIAREVLSRLPELPVYFVWVGAEADTPYCQSLKFDLERFELGDRIVLLPPTSKALDLMTRFDVFLLSSREDPYPLVVLEAALLQKPIVCFELAGGAPELVENDAGAVVGYLDINAASDALVRLCQNAELRKEMGRTAQQKVLERHNTHASIQKFLTIIQEAMGQKAPSILSQE